MQIDSSNRKGELKSFERGLEVYNFYLIPESTIYLFFLPLDLDEMNLKPQPKNPKLLWDHWHFKWESFKWQVGDLFWSEFGLVKNVNNLT